MIIVQKGHSVLTNAKELAQEPQTQMKQRNIPFTTSFCFPNHYLKLLITIQCLFKNTPFVDFTRAGEIGPNGMQQNEIVGLSQGLIFLSVANNTNGTMPIWPLGTLE